MKCKGRIATKRKKNLITTTGEIFPDGTIIEIVGGAGGNNKPDLLLWSRSAAMIASRVEYRGRDYEAPELDPSIYRATRLPAGCNDHHSVRELFDAIAALFDLHLQLPERDSRLLAIFSMSTWLADRLPMAPGLVFSGPDQRSGIELLRLLGSICRHPLLLTELTPGGFRSLPMQLPLTLLIDQQSLQLPMLRILRASSYRGLHVLGNHGVLFDIFGPKAILCGSDAVYENLSEGAIQISMVQTRPQRAALDETMLNKIADEMQPRLLSYRCTSLATSLVSPVDGTGFTAATRQLAVALGACLSKDPVLARDTVRLLQRQDDDARARQQSEVTCVLLEVLWALVHRGTSKTIKVDELAKMVNALSRSRGGQWIYSAEEMGWKLRALGIPRHSSAAGREVQLNPANRQRVHTLARTYDLSRSDIVAGCVECRGQEPAAAK